MTDRKTHWQGVYTRKSPAEVSWYQREPACSLQLIARSGIPKDAAIIDVGGGASVLVDCLLERGFGRVAVLDVSGVALAHSRDRLGARAALVQWHEGDITEFDPPHGFSLWHDRAGFHFLTDAADRNRYIGVLRKTLVTGGHLIIATFAVGGPPRCSGLDIVQYDKQRLMTELGDAFELIEQLDETHVTPDGARQLFSYFLCRRT